MRARFDTRRARMCGVRLDHADQAMAEPQRIVDHHKIARLEDVERHLSARQQQRARERKYRDHLGEVARLMIGRVHRHRRTPLRPRRPRDRWNTTSCFLILLAALATRTVPTTAA